MKKKLLALSIVAITAVACNSDHKAEKTEHNVNPFAVTGPLHQTGRAAPAHKERVIFDNVNLITMSENDVEEVLFDQRIVIEKNRIVEFGAATTIALDDADVIDGQNGFLLPGFIDSHAHITFDPIDENSGEEAAVFTDPAQMSMYLQQGITSIRSYSGTDRNIAWRDKVNSGEWLGTRILSSGPVILDRDKEEEELGLSFDDVADSFWLNFPFIYPVSESESKAAVIDHKERGFDYLKVYDGVSEENYLAVVEQAKEENMFIAGHIPEAPLETVLMNHDEIAHILMLIDSYDDYSDFLEWDEYVSEVIDSMVENDVSIVFNWSTDEVNMEMGEGIDVFSRARYGVIPPQILDGWKQKVELGENISREMHALAKSLVKDLIDGGVVVLAGSDTVDTGSIPEFVLRDLELMVDGGVSPYQALLTATVNPAHIISKITKKPTNRGQIKTGYLADLVLLKSNPLEDISHTRERYGVMVDGHWLSQEQLNLMVEEFVSMPLEFLPIELKD